MSMWTREEALAAHAAMNNGTPKDIEDADVVSDSPSGSEGRAREPWDNGALEMAAAAFTLSVIALGIALYVYTTREVPKP